MSREKQVAIHRYRDHAASADQDFVAVEEPLEIRIRFGKTQQRKTRTLAVTMRTPGHDFELAAGFLVSEGIVKQTGEITGHQFSGPVPDNAEQSNTVELELHPDVEFELSKLQRHFYTTSSCGVCGKASLDAIRADRVQPIVTEAVIPADLVHALPARLREFQKVFAQTGGLHAAGLASLQGEILASCEDIGRHNAVDKLIGSQLIKGTFPLGERVLVLSGRASFELMQKALLAQLPIVVAVGAPSSLAVELALEFQLTLVGFTSRERFNVYSHPERVRLPV